MSANLVRALLLAFVGLCTQAFGQHIDLQKNVTGRLLFGNLTQGSARSILGVTGNATADVASIQSPAADTVMRAAASGTSIGFGAIDLSKTNAVGSSILPVLNGGTNCSATCWVDSATGVTNQSIAGVKTFTTNLNLISSTVEVGFATSGWGEYAYSVINSADANDVASGFTNGLLVGISTSTAIKGGRVAITGAMLQTVASSASNSNRNYVGIVGLVSSTLGDGGVSFATAKGGYFGLNPVVSVPSAAYTLNVSGLEINTFIPSNTSTYYHSGVQVAPNDHTGRGWGVDAAIAISNQSVGAAGWRHGILFGNMNSNPAFTQSATWSGESDPAIAKSATSGGTGSAAIAAWGQPGVDTKENVWYVLDARQFNAKISIVEGNYVRIVDGVSSSVGGGNSGALSSVTATNLTGTLQTAAQTNITSLGTLTGLHISGAFDQDTGIARIGQVNTNSYPASGAGGGLGVSWNFSGGGAETSLWNLFDNGGGFTFRQKTGASTEYNDPVGLMNIDGSGNVTIPTVKSTTGVRYVCADTNGKLIGQAAACVGT